MRTTMPPPPPPIIPSPALVETGQCWKRAYRWGKLRLKLMESLYLSCGGMGT